MISSKSPDPNALRSFLARQSGSPFSYPEVGATKGNFPEGYNRDMRRWKVGQGEADFNAGVAAMKAWSMFPPEWTRVFPSEVPQAEGRVFAVIIRAFGVHWVNASKVVYLVEDVGAMKRTGFAYGTLDDHAETGEERFVLELNTDGSVWYDLSAFSKPRHWLARLGRPLTRSLQRKFAHASKKALMDAIADRRSDPKA